MTDTSGKIRPLIRAAAVMFASIFVVGFVFRLTEAGSLTPAALPASTLQTLEDVFNPLAGTFDSSGYIASASGNALEIARCIAAQMTGGECPWTGVTFTLLSGITADILPDGINDCDGDGFTDAGCVTVYCGDFLSSGPTGTYQTVEASFGGETRVNSLCNAGLPIIATCDDLGTGTVTISFCNGGICSSLDTDFTVTDTLTACAP